jgi:hypothetical protein
MNGFNDETMLLNLAAGLENDTAFMAHVLARYRQFEGLDQTTLAEELGIPLFLLARLALCRRPDADSPNFIDEVNEIADFVLADEMKLIRIIREVDSLTALDNRANNLETEEAVLENRFAAGILAAARDRSEDEDGDQTKKDADAD